MMAPRTEVATLDAAIPANLLALRLVRRSGGEGGSFSEGGKELGYGR